MMARPRSKNLNRQIPIALSLSTTFAILSSLITSPALAATNCVVPSDCVSGFCVDGFCCNAACNGACDACSAAKKGSGVDGECGLAAEGTTCKASYCNGDLFAYVGPSKCTAGGMCIEPSPVDCLTNNPCAIDLCSDIGCEITLKLDGSECGNGMTCQNGACGESMSSSSSSGAGGNGGSGGNGGMNTSSSSSSGSGGSGGTGGSSEVGGGGSSGTTDPYPPSTGKGCTCNVAENQGWSGTFSALLSGLALAARLMRRRQKI